nr:MAG TPA: hypothetical protein [Caudoviricetes sp.]
MLSLLPTPFWDTNTQRRGEDLNLQGHYSPLTLQVTIYQF